MKISTQDLECCFVIIKNDAVDIPHSRFQGRVLRRQRHCLRCWATTFGGVAAVDCDVLCSAMARQSDEHREH